MDELGTDLRGIRMCEFVEDGQGLMPGLVCGGGVAIAVVDVAEAGEGHSFEVAVAEFAPQCDRTLVIGDGLTGWPWWWEGVGLAGVVAGCAVEIEASTSTAKMVRCTADCGSITESHNPN
jgi:hypothetical protein